MSVLSVLSVCKKRIPTWPTVPTFVGVVGPFSGLLKPSLPAGGLFHIPW